MTNPKFTLSLQNATEDERMKVYKKIYELGRAYNWSENVQIATTPPQLALNTPVPENYRGPVTTDLYIQDDRFFGNVCPLDELMDVFEAETRS